MNRKIFDVAAEQGEPHNGSMCTKTAKPDTHYTTWRRYVLLAFKGFCMGLADVIPGVSGGTIAFMTGIYEDLIHAIKSFDLCFIRLLMVLKFREALQYASWRFLGTLLLGIITAVFSFSKIISWLLINYPVLINAFFFGLICATVPIISAQIKNKDLLKMLAGVCSALCMYLLVGLVPISTPDAGWFLFLSGALAICAMILPGISGAFILVLIGKYQFILEAVSHSDFGVLVIVGLGCAVGILSFVRILNWLLNHYHDMTLTILAGLVLGSLRKVWPWKETLQSILTHKGKIIPVEQFNILPSHFSADVGFAVILILVGFALGMAFSPTRANCPSLK